MAKSKADRMRVKLREFLPGWTGESWPTLEEFLSETRMRIEVTPSHYYTIRKEIISELGLDEANKGTHQNIPKLNKAADDKVMETLQRRAASLANLMKSSNLEEVTVVRNDDGGFHIEVQQSAPPRKKIALEN
jgi:hypothetical protein